VSTSQPEPSNDLRELFLGLQEEFLIKLGVTRKALAHPGAKGGATESHWLEFLRGTLPHRYQVAKGFVIDSIGTVSDEIDCLLYDRQYSPIVFQRGDSIYIPAESVYAVLEVKQEIDAATVAYAANKVASVRKLVRTSAPIIDRGATHKPRQPFPILGAILALDSGWSPMDGEPLMQALAAQSAEGRLDLGCAVSVGAFTVDYPTVGRPTAQVCVREVALMSFVLNFLTKLQALGTVPAVDWTAYARALTAT